MPSPAPPANTPRPAPPTGPARGHVHRRIEPRNVFATTFWLIFKNVIGWMLIVASPVLGITVPGPGGIPVFLIGFALVTFPGKRRLTSRVLRGRGVVLPEGPFTFLCALFSVLLTTAAVWFVLDYFEGFAGFFARYRMQSVAAIFAFAVISFGITWAVVAAALAATNFVIRRIPWLRRKFRPFFKKFGIRFLPARRKRLLTEDGRHAVVENEEIIEFHEEYSNVPRRAWDYLQPWLKRILTVGVTLLIFAAMVRPLKERWPVAQQQLAQMSLMQFAMASVMFAFFLFAFRALAWRRILKGFGHRLPVAAASRIWITSELARYLPGAIWQVVGRVMLVKPYGVSGSVCSTTQVLELCVFLMANVLLASACWLYYGAKELQDVRGWFYAAIALVPALALILHPKVFYSIVNFVLRKIGKPVIVKRLRGKQLVYILAWTILGLLWQSLAVYLIAKGPLGLKIDWLWIIAGAYSLAWCAGFLAVWAPGGIGVRELVFVAAMSVMLPDSVRAQPPFNGDAEATASVLVGLGLLLRLWSILGELIMAGAVYVADYRGALGLPGAPGRLPTTGAAAS
jgi:hypothetical protein